MVVNVTRANDIADKLRVVLDWEYGPYCVYQDEIQRPRERMIRAWKIGRL